MYSNPDSMRLRAVGLGCCVLAFTFLLWGITQIMIGPSPDYADTGLIHAVAAFVPAAVLLVSGVWLMWANPKPRT
jgi:hypothetical protein